MTPKDLEHWERIFKYASICTRGEVQKGFTAMATKCKEILDEENAKDREEK